MAEPRSPCAPVLPPTSLAQPPVLPPTYPHRHIPSPHTWTPLQSLPPRPPLRPPTPPPPPAPPPQCQVHGRGHSRRPAKESPAPPPAETRPAADGPPRDAPGAERPGANVVARLSRWADDNLYLIRNISTGMAVVGIMLFARSIRLTSKFVSPADIPIEFIKKNVKLRGRLRRITEKGLEVEHIPITIPLISTWKKEPYGVLLIKLAGVELTESGQVWLRKELEISQMLWFQLLGRENSSLVCHLLVNRGGYFNVSLNEEILRRGLGKTVLIKELDHNSKVYWKIHKNLLKAELQAIRKGKGIWKEHTEKSNYIQKFKGSWREMWGNEEESSLKKMSGWSLDRKKDSFSEMLTSLCEKYKDKINKSTLVLKLREYLSRVKLGKRK